MNISSNKSEYTVDVNTTPSIKKQAKKSQEGFKVLAKLNKKIWNKPMWREKTNTKLINIIIIRNNNK